MARYVISDHHFGHSNIIKYCDRPFSTVGQMNSTLLENHYEQVNAEDLLIQLGDVAMDMQDGQETIKFFERLDGDVLIQGNHDIGLTKSDAPFPVFDSCTIEHGGIEFYCTHKPEDIPEHHDGWAIHGHIHNNNTEDFPFIAADKKCINVSCELLDYTPISIETLVDIISACATTTRLRDRATAVEYFDSK